MASPTLAQVCMGRAPDVVIGVDTHKVLHVAVALAPNGGKLGEHRIPTTRMGYGDLIVWSEEFGSNPVYAIEGTGSYGAGLTRELQDAGFPVMEVNRTDRSVRRRLGKDVDAVFREAVAIDAEAAARSYLAGTATATPKTGADQVEMIRML
jgi:transposase